MTLDRRLEFNSLSLKDIREVRLPKELTKEI